MTENMWLAVIICSTVLLTIGLIAFLVAFFGTGTNSNTSNFETWATCRKEIAVAQARVQLAEAEHMRRCPRLTDQERA